MNSGSTTLAAAFEPQGMGVNSRPMRRTISDDVGGGSREREREREREKGGG